MYVLPSAKINCKFTWYLKAVGWIPELPPREISWNFSAQAMKEVDSKKFRVLL